MGAAWQGRPLRFMRLAWSVALLAQAALAMLTLPADVNFLEAIVLPRDQAYLARG